MATATRQLRILSKHWILNIDDRVFPIKDQINIDELLLYPSPHRVQLGD